MPLSLPIGSSLLTSNLLLHVTSCLAFCCDSSASFWALLRSPSSHSALLFHVAEAASAIKPECRQHPKTGRPYHHVTSISKGRRASSLGTRLHKKITMIMLGFLTTEATAAKTHPDSVLDGSSLGGPLGARAIKIGACLSERSP